MARFLVEESCTAEVIYVYEVEARSEEEAKAIINTGTAELEAVSWRIETVNMSHGGGKATLVPQEG